MADRHERYRTVLEMREGNPPASYVEIGTALGLSHHTARQIYAEASALKRAGRFDGDTFLTAGLSGRVSNILWRAGIRTPAAVRAMSERELFAVRNFTPAALAEVKAKLGYKSGRSHSPQAAWPSFRLIDGKPVSATGERFPEPLEYDLRRAVWTDESGEMLVGDTVYSWLTFPGYSGPAVLLT